MSDKWPPLGKWPYPGPGKVEFTVNPGVNRYFVSQCLTERYPNLRFKIAGEAANTITVFEELTEITKQSIENDIQVLCIAYQQAQNWEW